MIKYTIYVYYDTINDTIRYLHLPLYSILRFHSHCKMIGKYKTAVQTCNMNYYNFRGTTYQHALSTHIHTTYIQHINIHINMCSPVAQSGERPTAEPTGSESPVRAASRARYLLLTGMACDLWQRSHTAQRKSVSGAGRLRL